MNDVHSTVLCVKPTKGFVIPLSVVVSLLFHLFYIVFEHHTFFKLETILNFVLMWHFYLRIQAEIFPYERIWMEMGLLVNV